MEGLYYPCNENKGAYQLRFFVFAYEKNRFSHNEAHIICVTENQIKCIFCGYLGICLLISP